MSDKVVSVVVLQCWLVIAGIWSSLQGLKARCVLTLYWGRVQETLEQLSLDEEKPVDEMWRQGGEATHDLPDHAATRTP
jgi:hypothetical protein